MPIYCFKCKQCGGQDEVFRASMNDSEKPHMCPDCRIFMIRDYQNGRPHVTPERYSRTIISDALGIHPSQAAEHKQVYPDIPITPTGQLVFESYKQHDKYLAEQGYQYKSRQRKLKGKIIKISEMSSPR